MKQFQFIPGFWQRPQLSSAGTPAWTATQQIHADVLLQVLHLSAQRRLREPKLRSGFGELQRFTRRQKISQMSEFHSRVPLFRKSIAAHGTWIFFCRVWGSPTVDCA